MGTVGLSFGAATSGQGFDVASTVTQIQAASAAIENPWNSELSTLQAQDTVFTSLGTDLSTLTTSLQALTDFEGVFSEKEGSSSDPDTLALSSATSSATAGSHTVLVNSLATTSSDVSDTLANANDTLSGNVVITVNGQSSTIDVDSSSNTLSTLASAINSADAGVTATVLTDSSGSRLSLVSATSGAAGNITVSGSLSDTTTGGNLAFTSSQTGADASIVVDGTTLTSSSNTVTNAIPGVTFQLLAKSASSTSPVQIQITNDNTDVETAITNFVNAYNAVATDLTTQTGKDSSGNPEPLAGTPILSQLQSSLSGALFAGSASGSINSLEQLGISVNSDGSGTLTLDGDTLDAALDNNYSDVTGFFQNTGSFGQTLSTTLNNLGTQAPDGAIFLAQQQNSTQEAALNTDITNENTLLATQKTQLTDELNAANQTLQGIPSQLDEVNSIFDSLTGFNPNSQA
ncbi:flagellar filament capping protein FliD [Granulicella sp. L60]|uniref:flagellar filament capping protein FliD n=1 Tax=Granulicella sp. L60 TaxID=1641866 RepID=UPI00131B522B|nr:flagellar filament capping protein FliD [Granulicella sp. L60]